jgi:hypothetical protein
MPQGKSKLNAAKQSSGGKKKVADKKKGLRAIAPKNKQTVRQATQHKVSLASLLPWFTLLENLVFNGEEEECWHLNHDRFVQKMSAKINNSIEQQMIAAASAGKLTIMRGAAEEG